MSSLKQNYSISQENSFIIKKIPNLPIEVAEKFLSPLELEIYKMILQLEEGKKHEKEL